VVVAAGGGAVRDGDGALLVSELPEDAVAFDWLGLGADVEVELELVVGGGDVEDGAPPDEAVLEVPVEALVAFAVVLGVTTNHVPLVEPYCSMIPWPLVWPGALSPA